eukprot:Em0006g205a
MSSTGKLSGAQRRKRKAKAAEEARKSSKLLAAFLKVDKEAEHDDLGSKSANEESEANRMESEVTSDNINDSDETSDESEVVAGQEDPKPGPSQLIYHNNPIITFGDIGFMSFTAAARPCIDDATKELLVKTGPDAFRNEDATLPRTLSGTKAVARGMTKNWWQAVRDPSGLGDDTALDKYRRVAHVEEFYEIICEVHENDLLHTGYKKTFEKIHLAVYILLLELPETCPSLPYVALSTTISPAANGGFAVFTL